MKPPQLVLLTGGTGKLGIFTAKYLVEHGYTIILTSRKINAAKEACHNIIHSSNIDEHKIKNILFPFCLDISNKRNIEHFVESLLNKKIIPHALVNIAAIDNQNSLESLNYKSMENILRVNFTGTAYLSFLLSSYWKNNGINGSIVTISTLLTCSGANNSAIYAASKAALEAFFINLAVEHGKYGIRSNILRIAGMVGDLMLEFTPTKVASLNEEIYENNTLDQNIIPLTRFGTFSEFSSAIEFLISNKSSYISGQCINVDGGLSSVYPGYSLSPIT